MEINEDDATSLIVAKHHKFKGGDFTMLMPQIEFLKYKEAQRHDLETEALGWANNVLEHLKLEEQRRHNLATEDIAMRDLAEKIRHNLASENQQDRSLAIQQFVAETRQGELAWKQIVDPQRLAIEATTAQSHMMSAGAALSQAQSKQREIELSKNRNRIESYKARTERSKVQSQNLRNLRDVDLKERELKIEDRRADIQERDAEINRSRMILEGAKDLQKSYENSQTGIPGTDYNNRRKKK